ncbi:MAG: hypothetical protein DRN31_00425 [Thermoplasmata archaeon]|nr:MAG: hypothetical protein DRN31_00425 [Thermoplasmata archaeon]
MDAKNLLIPYGFYDMKNFRMLIFAFSVIAILLLSGCVKKHSGKENIMEISSGRDDGAVFIFTDSLPNISGMVSGGGNVPVTVGLFTLGNGKNLTGRAIYRFNMSNWEGGDLTFHLKCIQKYGNPGDVEIYVSNDSGSLPLYSSEMKKVSLLWNLANSGKLVSTYAPQSEKWMEILIPSFVVNARIDNGYLTIILKLKNEDIGSNSDYYAFSTYEYNRGASKPYLIEI